MTNLPFRVSTPLRKSQKTYTSYQAYKNVLRDDFNRRCGYTDCADKWFGGVTTFHIDHFQPYSVFPNLKSTYSNLVYSCSYVNILKSNDDPSKYLEPCSDDYNIHFYRDKFGVIIPSPNSPKAIYMHKKMKLGLARYSTIWLIDKLYDCMKQMQILLANLPDGDSREKEVKKNYIDLTLEFTKYFDYLTDTK